MVGMSTVDPSGQPACGLPEPLRKPHDWGHRALRRTLKVVLERTPVHEDPAFRVVGPFKPRRKASPAYRASVVGCMVDIDDLVGAAEIAERLDHSGGTLIHDWQRRYPDFPAPVLELQQGPQWTWSEVAAWARAAVAANMFSPGP